LARARDLIERIDSPESRSGNLHVVYLRNAQATRLAEVLRGALSGENGGGSADAGGLSSGGLSGGQLGNAAGALSGLNTGSAQGSGMGMGMGASANRNAGGGSGASPGALGGSDNNLMRPVAFSAGGATIQADPSTNTLII